jgi:hypothetical protein
MSDFTQHNKALTQLCGIPISIHRVSGADIFYTDGAAAGATFRLHLPDSSMVFLANDGSEHTVFDSPLFVKHSSTIQQYIATSLNFTHDL